MTAAMIGERKVRYWLQGAERGNFGDYITQIMLDRLLDVPRIEADAYHLIGSVIDEGIMQDSLLSVTGEETGKVVFWGCGLRADSNLSPWARAHAIFCGIRGPLSRDRLALAAETPIGDPGLLLPLIVPLDTIARHGRSLCLLHALDAIDEETARVRTGADMVRRALIPPTAEGFLDLLSCIAGARFVLTGALHGAIAAFAYGVPFAYLDLGYVDCPFKWADFSASIGIEPLFATTVDEGEAIHEAFIAPRASMPELGPILAVAPFSLKISVVC